MQQKATGVDTSKCAEKVDLANFKSNVDKSDIDKLKNVPTNLSSLKSKGDKLDVDKLVPVPADALKVMYIMLRSKILKIKYLILLLILLLMLK